MEMDYRELASHFDHTLLKPTATEADLKNLCSEAVNYGFASVCVNLCRVSLVHSILAQETQPIKVCSVLDFPFGSSTPQQKLSQLKQAVELGACEADVVVNIGKLLEGDVHYCIKELKPLAEFAHEHKCLLKVIVETCYLDKPLIQKACEIVEASGADFIKTSTGYGTRGASFDDITLFKKYLQGAIKIKASGGIGTLTEALKYLELGCTRLGTSRTVAIMNEAYTANRIAGLS